jgi:hypothetical protein
MLQLNAVLPLRAGGSRRGSGRPQKPQEIGNTEPGMFEKNCRIRGFDNELADAIDAELTRQQDHVELIASENYASPR